MYVCLEELFPLNYETENALTNCPKICCFIFVEPFIWRGKPVQSKFVLMSFRACYFWSVFVLQPCRWCTRQCWPTVTGTVLIPHILVCRCKCDCRRCFSAFFFFSFFSILWLRGTALSVIHKQCSSTVTVLYFSTLIAPTYWGLFFAGLSVIVDALFLCLHPLVPRNDDSVMARARLWFIDQSPFSAGSSDVTAYKMAPGYSLLRISEACLLIETTQLSTSSQCND